MYPELWGKGGFKIIQYNSLAEAMKQWRFSHSYSLNDAAKVTGIPQSTISSYEQRKYMPSSKNIKLLAKVLNVGSADILKMAEFDQGYGLDEK